MILYKYNQYPLKVAVNYVPGDYVNNLKGDVFFVTKLGELELINTSVLIDNETVLGLNELTYRKLFIPLSNKRRYVREIEEAGKESEE